MGTPKGESRSRSARSRGGDRRPETSSQTVRTDPSEYGERAGPSGVMEQAVIDAQATGLEESIDTEHESADSAAGESPVLVSKPVEIGDEASNNTAPEVMSGSRDLPAGGSANSNHRADIVQVPPSFPPDVGYGESPEARSARRDHAARLEAASVLDAPSSLHESVSPPSAGSWALRLWVAAMLGIIGMAGIVALRDRGGAPEAERSAQPLSPQVATGGVPPAAAPVVAPSVEKKPAPVTAVAPEPAPREPVRALPSANAAAPTPARAQAPTPPEADQGASSEPPLKPELAEESPEARVRARRAALPAAAEVAGSPVGEAQKPPTRTRVAPVEPAKSAPPTAPALNPGAVQEPSGTPPAVPQIPSNPYEVDDSVASGAP